MNKKERKLKITAEDFTQKVSINVKLYDREDEGVTIDEFYSACVQLAYGMGYTKETIKKYFTHE
jgi:hypothetical protein